MGPFGLLRFAVLLTLPSARFVRASSSVLPHGGDGEVMVVTGMWFLKHAKHNISEYLKWANNTSTLQANTLAFGDEKGCSLMETSRKSHNLPIKCHRVDDVGSFETTSSFLSAVTTDLTSISSTSPNLNFNHRIKLREQILSYPLGLIWSAKSELVLASTKMIPPKSKGGYDWFAWIDFGINSLRGKPSPDKVFPFPGSMDRMPSNRVLVSMTQKLPFGKNCRARCPNVKAPDTKWDTDYVATLHWNCMRMNMWMAHRDIIPEFRKAVAEEQKQCIWEVGRLGPGSEHRVKHCMDDQNLISKIFRRRPSLFAVVGAGWGSMLANFWKPEDFWEHHTLFPQPGEEYAHINNCHAELTDSIP